MGWGELFSISCAATWAVAVVLFKRSGETLPAFALNFYKNLLATILMLPTALVFSGAQLPDYTWQQWLIVLASGYLGIALADTWYFKALNLIGASRTGIVATLYSPSVIVLSALFLGERLGGWQFAGFILVMIGIFLVTYRQPASEVSPHDLRKGVLLGAGAVMLMAVGVVMVKEILEQKDFFWTVEIRLFGGLLGMLLTMAWGNGFRRVYAQYRRPQPWGMITLASVLGAYIPMILWLAGYKLTDASIASVLNETASAFIVLFAWLILKEHISARKLIGMTVTLAGVIVIVSV